MFFVSIKCFFVAPRDMLTSCQLGFHSNELFIHEFMYSIVSYDDQLETKKHLDTIFISNLEEYN
jgi:hypothetical protein